MIWLTLVFASLLSVAGQLCQKQATCFVAINKRRKHIVLWLGLALACLGLAMVLWLLVLQNVPVGIAYPMLSLNFVWVKDKLARFQQPVRWLTLPPELKNGGIKISRQALKEWVQRQQ